MTFTLRPTLLLALGLVACSPQQPAEQATPAPTPAAVAPAPAPAPVATDVLSAQGWGPLRIGMTRAEVTQALGDDANPGAVGGADPEQCDQYHPARAPQGLMVMLEKGVLTRITLMREATVKTDLGLGLGATAAQVKAAAPGGVVSPHKYEAAPAEYVTVWSPPRQDDYVQDPAARGVRYEIAADGKVAQIHAGGPSIQYVEGCA